METFISRSSPTFIQSTMPIMRGVFLEALRRKEFYSVFLIAGVFVIGAIAVRIVGIENASTGTFILNLGMTYAYFAAHLVVGLLIIKQVPSEIENRTLYPILAKPINRFTYLVGKWAAVVFTGSAIYLALTMFVWIAAPKMESFNSLLLIQNVLLHIISMAALCAIGLLFSILTPMPVAMIITGLVFAFGNKLVILISTQLRDSNLRGFFDWLLGYVPNFSKMNLITRYTDGIEALGVVPFLGLLTYGLILIGFPLILSSAIFSRRPL